MQIIEKKIPIYRLKDLPVRADLMRMRFEIPDDATQRFEDLMAAIDTQMDALAQE
jgi:hypothetical protein